MTFVNTQGRKQEHLEDRKRDKTLLEREIGDRLDRQPIVR
jgi:hypothetical protein